MVVLDIDHFEQLNDAAATPRATRRCGSPRACSRASCGPATCAAGSAATSSCSPCPTPTPGAPSASSSGCAARSPPRRCATRRRRRPGLTFSAGIAEFPRDARDQIGLMRLAEGALYRAKRSGRNRCVVYSSFVDAPLSLQEEAERARTAGLANTVYALARAVDLKDGYTHQHSARVAQYAAVLAREFGMSRGGDRPDPDRRHPARRRQGRRRRRRAAQARPADRRRVPRDAAPLHARPRHHRRRRACRRSPSGCSTCTSAGTAAATRTSSRATTSRSPAACSASPTRSRR